MKNQIQALLEKSILSLKEQGIIPADHQCNIILESTRDPAHGDLASNLAMTLAKPCRSNPRVIAQAIVDALPASDLITKTDIAGPGFINFYLSSDTAIKPIRDLLTAGDSYGYSKIGNGKSVQVEFVSANPTGPLHVGHGRGAAYGATVSDLLAAVGFNVDREYYVNDAGRQMNILATSVWLRYLQLNELDFDFPTNGYKGDYIYAIASQIKAELDKKLVRPLDDVYKDVPADGPDGDKELHIDALIKNAQDLLGDAGYETFFAAALNSIRGDIEDDLREFGIEYQHWFSERSLTQNDSEVDKAINRLQENGHVYEKEGALWFKSTDFGDDKDRVLKRDNGQTTYFASDIAYHKNKYERGYDSIVNIWGADHHGYIVRVKAAVKALGFDPDKLVIPMVQFANLYRGSEKLPMSTRSGEFVTLRELRDEVGNDAARFIYVTRKVEQHMDFDLELAKTQSKDNPVYYVQYAHARVCSILRKLNEQGTKIDTDIGLSKFDLLKEEQEAALIKELARFPEWVEKAALNYEPHVLANYLRDLASIFHNYYNGTRILVDENDLLQARMTLSIAVKQVLKTGLKLLGVSAPEVM